MNPIMYYDFSKALAEAGVFTEDELNNITRIVIDVKHGDFVVMYVEYFGDERILKVAQTLNGVVIEGVPAEAKTGQDND